MIQHKNLDVQYNIQPSTFIRFHYRLEQSYKQNQIKNSNLLFFERENGKTKRKTKTYQTIRVFNCRIFLEILFINHLRSQNLFVFKCLTKLFKSFNGS